MNRLLFIVSRGRPDLYSYLLAHFAEEKDVEVILDRRQDEQKGKDRRTGPERRRSKGRPLLTSSDGVTMVEVKQPPAPSAADPARSESQQVKP